MNVVVVAAHGLHCHWLGPYGNEWVSTPAFDALATESVVFDRHFADEPSTTAFASSCPPTLLQSLKASGISTAFVDDRKSRPPDRREWDVLLPTDLASHATPGDALIATFESALDRLSSRSTWLLWVETDRFLPPWDFDQETYQHYASATARFTADEEGKPPPIPDPITEPVPGRLAPDDDSAWHRLQNSFAATVTSFDAELEVLIEVLRERGLDQTAAWIFTSGYGWPLGEHGVVGPAESRMHTELVHLPLLIRLPKAEQAMRRVAAFTQTSDLAPTLHDLFGMPAMANSLLPLATGSRQTGHDVARSASVRATHTERAIRTFEWAFLPAVPEADEPPRLFRKPDDIWEVNDLAPRHPDECDRLAAFVNDATAKEPTP